MSISIQEVTICKTDGTETEGTLFRDDVTGDRIVYE